LWRIGGGKACARVAKLAIEVFGVTPDLADLKSVAYEGIERFRAWVRAIGMPSTLGELGVGEKDLPVLLDKARYNQDGVIEGYVVITRGELEAFYRSIM
jgi:alcohol dehydrogenase YqhD (iron-dependent ADH family)